MSPRSNSVTHPRGRLPARVYWTRRGLLVAVVVGLVVGITHLVGGGGSAPSAPAARMAASQRSTAPDPQPVVQGPAAVVTTPARHRKHAKNGKQHQAPSATPSATPLAAPDGPCNPGDLSAEPVITQAAAGHPIDLDLAIHGTAAACTFKVSPKTLVVKVTSGPDDIWSSQDCRHAVPHRTVVVRSAKPAEVTVSWDGHRSGERCGASNPWAEPGYYHAHAAVLGSVPSDQQFQLTLPPRAVITKTVHPKPTRSGKTDGNGVSGKQSACGGDSAC